MNTFLLFCRFAGAALLLYGVFPGAAAAASPSRLYAGASETEITPSAGTPLSGYGHLRGKATQGVHSPIYARASALSDGSQTYLFLSLDLCLIDKNLRNVIVEKIRMKHDLHPARFLVTASHTHTGPGAVGGCFWHRFIMGKFDQEVFDFITDGAAEAGLKALRSLQPVQAEYAETRIDELVENRMISRLRYPFVLKSLRLRSGPNIVANFIFMAAHPTLFPAKEMLQFSTDYPGVIAAELKKKHPSAVTIFINGAAGDLRPKVTKEGDRIQKMEDYGRALAGKIPELDYRPLDLSGPWKAVFQEDKLPRVKSRLGWFRIPSFVGNRVFATRTYWQIIRLGPLVWISFSGELTSEIGHEMERLARDRGLVPFIAGYANDYIAYVVPRRYYSLRDEYEPSVSFYGREMDWFVLRKSERLLDTLLSPAEKEALNPPGILKRSDGLPVLKVSGTPYHRGFEEGRLLKNEIQTGMDGIFGYFRKELKVPLINRLIIWFAGERAWKQISPYLSYREYEEIRGLAAGAGVSLDRLERLHALPELFPALCTNGAYWGNATEGGRLIAIRNLDWNREMGVQNLAAVKYAGNPSGKDYVNIGYAGFSGVLSGLNEEGISVGQIGAVSADETMEGVSMPYLLKRILEEASSLEDAKNIFTRSELTRGYNYVIADAVEKKAFAAEATKSRLEFFSDNDPREADVPYAVRIEDAVLRADPALDPGIRGLQDASGSDPKKPGLEPPAGSAYEIRYVKHGRLIKEHYGRITPETARKFAREVAPKSNIQSVIYAFPEFWVANAEGDKKAADSLYHHFNFHELAKWETTAASGTAPSAAADAS